MLCAGAELSSGLERFTFSPILHEASPEATSSCSSSVVRDFHCPAHLSGGSVHGSELFVEVFAREIGTVLPRNRRELAVEIELGESFAIAQRLEYRSIQLVRKIDKPFASVVELQPHLVIASIARCDHVTRRSFVAGHCDVLFARFARMHDCSICFVVGVN